jgi:xanthine/uracil/vitamin C permease
LVKFFGRHAVEKILPPTITGPVAMIIGLTLAGNALTDAAPKNVICPDLQNTALVQEYAAADYQDYLAKIGAAENPLEGEAQIKEQIVLLEKTVDKLPEGKSEARSNLESELKSLRKTYTSGTDWVWVVSLVTLLATVLFSKYLKGFLGQLPLLLGALTGCAVAFVILLINDDLDLFRSMSAAALAESPWKSPHGIIAVPAFSFPKVSWAAVAAIMPIAIATIPESTAHMYQLDIYVNDIAKKKGKKLGYNLIDMLDRNLIGDGLCDMISGAVGGPAGTNYGENISTMAITRVFSVPVLAVAAIFAMVISFFTPLIQIVYGIPLAVIGGLEIYLFGAIAAQGIAIMIDKKADMFSAKNIAVIASIMVIGIGGNYAFGGNIPFFGLDVPCIAGAAIFGILLNLLLSIGDKKHREEQIETVSPEEQKES